MKDKNLVLQEIKDTIKKTQDYVEESKKDLNDDKIMNLIYNCHAWSLDKILKTMKFFERNNKQK